MKKNIFLNLKYLVKWTEKGTAFLVQSPFNPNAGIWWSANWYQESQNWPDKYFATGIVFEQEYDEVIYSSDGIKHINKIKGKDLYDQFQSIVKYNKTQYLKMAIATALKMKHLSDEQTLPKNNQSNKIDLIQKLSWK